MKRIKFSLFILLMSNLQCWAQPCVDPSLIDSMAICPMIYAPVCGCDGITYSNACIATNLGGVTSYVDGACSGCINLGQIDTLAFCSTEVDPVCGCDSVTYNNACQAYYYGGVTSYQLGTCFQQELDTCMSIPSGVDFGACAMIVGVIRQNDSCFTVSGCGPLGSNGIDYSGYFYNSLYACNNLCGLDTTVVLSCIDTSQINLNVLCPGIVEPVCGCDSVTYQNSCIAMYYHGIVNFQPGPCPGASLDDLGFFDLNVFPNPTLDRVHFSGRAMDDVEFIKLTSADGKGLQINKAVQEWDLTTLTQGYYHLEFVFYNGLQIRRKLLKL